MIQVDDDGVLVTPFLRTQFNYDRDRASLETALICEEETRTQQQFKEECDINTIIDRFGLGGEIPQSARIPFTGDFSEARDYRESLHLMMAAEDAFMQYPANIRAQFQNDPVRFVDFVSDPANKEQVKLWGLARVETPLPAPIDVRVIPNPPDPTKTP